MLRCAQHNGAKHKMADGIQQPLRSELLAMLREHKRSSAITRYREASGQDYRTAIFVLNDLQQDLAQQLDAR